MMPTSEIWSVLARELDRQRAEVIKLKGAGYTEMMLIDVDLGALAKAVADSQSPMKVP